MPFVIGATKEEASQALDAVIQHHCAIVFQFGCRLAARITASGTHGDGYIFHFEFMALMPGEFPAEYQGWTLYEDRAGCAAGRTV